MADRAAGQDQPRGVRRSEIQGVKSCITSVPVEIINLVAEQLNQADIKCLLLTCQELASILQPLMVRRDIDDKIYNSLSWACYFNHVSLGRTCMEMGAFPNAAFFLHPSQGLPFQGKENWPDSYESRLHHDHFEFPVYPTKKLLGIPLFYQSECASRSALSVATKRDHLDMVKLLLEFGADIVEKRRGMRHNVNGFTANHPSRPYGDARHFSHEVIMSHVRSVPVAEALLAAGAAYEINYAGFSGYTPLEMLLSSCSRYRLSLLPELTEPELHALVRIFLENGAQTKRANEAAGPLLAAIATDYLSVFQLLLEHTTMDLDNEDEEHSAVLSIALGEDQTCFDDDCPLPESTRGRILTMMFDTGISPNHIIAGQGPLLHTAIMKNSHRSAQVLISHEADVNFTDPSNLSPLATAIACSGHTMDIETEFIVPLIRAGADIDQPSLWSGGFTPLMVAAADMISHRIFENLLQFGANRGAIRRMSPNGSLTSVLQCIVTGLPKSDFEWEDVAERGLYSDSGLYSLRSDPDRRFERDSIFERRRKNKFATFISRGITPAHFYTNDGRHVINWAIENLYQYDLEWAIETLLPQYHESKLPSDTESPILTLFSVRRVETYLAFGTIHQTLRITEALVKKGITVTTKDRMEGGETVLHRVSRLRQGYPDESDLELATSLGEHLDFGLDLSNESEVWNLKFKANGAPRFMSTTRHWSRLPVKKHMSLYVDARNYVITRMIELFMRHGVDLYAEDANGKTAFERIEEDILLGIPQDLRDLGREKEIVDSKMAKLRDKIEKTELIDEECF
ncbi:ankyrin repeat-containing domain protein [Thelonectria olida]|uniref:Ankyrin repeat-containing domain protein n=1 Tax=Thelonectria olida TaxID=1576542 RepID=A0A9P8WBX5_9HYPO|nr:ankyrin repeat-containing domain protein [Thelonectria olida]